MATPRSESIILRWILGFAYAAMLTLPAWVFFSSRGGMGFLEGTDFQSASSLLFPLAGLYAFTFVWSQVMIGANLWYIRSRMPWLARYHRRQGIAALVFALLHPTLILAGFGLNEYVHMTFVTPEHKLFVWVGEFQLLLILATVSAALLRRQPWIRRWWHTVHLANYVVFVSAWIHSWFLGSDVQTTNLRWLWLFFGCTVLVSIMGRVMTSRVAKTPKTLYNMGDADPPTKTT